MGLSGAAQAAVDAATGAILGVPGGTELAVVTPPGGAPPVANVPVIVRYTNDVVRQGRAGAQKTGAIVKLRRVDHPAHPAIGATVVRASRPDESLEIVSVERELAWWSCEAKRV